ncbi:endonuclease domain-containing protein [Sphingomonas sp. R1]|uniref:endonuclease domain-containing protein n=1 Tax=Sphingomonas sp. R1 TaxID=399176 RepID=UPI0022254937|nr:endonuclease domain-containing protein [Sphingomonas sp. R1]UYY77972.1 endonuclease domain-containing protein [Sphingomonas sp. R1]
MFTHSKLWMQARAKELRHNPTPMEQKLWQRLRASQLEGLKFRFQHVIEPAIVDFCCPSIGLVVEIDGDTHDADADRDRDIGLAQLGYTVLRFTNHEVATNLDGVLQTIADRARGLPIRQWNRGSTHPPAPSLGREGER